MMNQMNFPALAAVLPIPKSGLKLGKETGCLCGTFFGADTGFLPGRCYGCLTLSSISLFSAS